MSELNIRYPYIVADIGGTNARFGLVTGFDPEAKEFVIENQQMYESEYFESIERAFTCYRNSLEQAAISGACLAVAGPVVGDRIKLTNLQWNFSVLQTQKNLGLDKLKIINDFSAYAYAIQYIDKKYLRNINEGVAVEGSPIMVVGPGTGFGVAALTSQNGTYNVLASEGGHMSLAANTPLQAAIKEQLSRKHALVSIERVFSGPGLKDLYEALMAVEGMRPRKLTAAQISQLALESSDEMCHRTLALFCSWLGAVTGDLALALGARGGVFMGGGILPRIADFLVQSEFRAAFKAKDQMSHYLQDIPVDLVTEGNSALMGAAACFESSYR